MIERKPTTTCTALTRKTPAVGSRSKFISLTAEDKYIFLLVNRKVQLTNINSINKQKSTLTDIKLH